MTLNNFCLLCVRLVETLPTTMRYCKQMAQMQFLTFSTTIYAYNELTISYFWSLWLCLKITNKFETCLRVTVALIWNKCVNIFIYYISLNMPFLIAFPFLGGLESRYIHVMLSFQNLFCFGFLCEYVIVDICDEIVASTSFVYKRIAYSRVRWFGLAKQSLDSLQLLWYERRSDWKLIMWLKRICQIIMLPILQI